VETKPSSSLETALRAVRESSDAAAVRAAIMDLGYETAPEVYPVLVERLSDPNPGVQHAAVLSLGRYGRPEAIEELVKPKIFRSSIPNIRWAAVAALGKLGDFRVIENILKAVDDPEWIVRTQAVTEIKGKVQDVITRRSVRLAHVLIHMLSLENEEIVDLSIEGFQEFGQECLPLLHEVLINSSATVRANAARALGKLKSRHSVPYLMDLLQDGEWKVRVSAAEALGLIGDASSIEALILKVQDNVSRVQEEASLAIVKFGRHASMPLLNALSRERDKFALVALLRCLGRIGDPKSVPALIFHLRSSYFIVRQAAISALVRFGPSVASLIIPTLSFNRSDIEILKKDACDKEHPELQIRAIKALGGLEDHRAVGALKYLVKEGLPDIQDAATQALIQIGCAAWGRCCALKVLAEVADASLVPLIALSTQDNSDNVRMEAIRAMGKLGGPMAVRYLVRAATKDRAAFVRGEAIRSLRTIGAGRPGVLKAGLHCLKDGSRDLRSQAARLLGIFQDPISIMPLLKAMADPHWSVRESAENALLNFGGAAVRPLIDALSSKSWTTRFRTVRLLGEIGDPQAVPPLERLLVQKGERKKVREVAEISLRKLKNAAQAQ
jgi:HEAT repeat protein